MRHKYKPPLQISTALETIKTASTNFGMRHVHLIDDDDDDDDDDECLPHFLNKTGVFYKH